MVKKVLLLAGRRRRPGCPAGAGCAPSSAHPHRAAGASGRGPRGSRSGRAPRRQSEGWRRQGRSLELRVGGCEEPAECRSGATLLKTCSAASRGSGAEPRAALPAAPRVLRAQTGERRPGRGRGGGEAALHGPPGLPPGASHGRVFPFLFRERGRKRRSWPGREGLGKAAARPPCGIAGRDPAAARGEGKSHPRTRYDFILFFTLLF